MDANWLPVQGSNPLAGVDLNAPAAAADWRAQLDPESRSRTVNTIFETLQRHLPVSVPEGVNELQKIALRFEEKIYTAATSEHDYMQKISLKMLSMETRRQQAPGNALVMPIQNNPNIHELALVGIQQSAPLMHADPHHGRQLAAHAGVQPPADVNMYTPAPDAGGDWHTQLDAESRSRIVNQIMEALKRHLPVSVPEGVNELQKIAVRFEEKIYTSATSQPDYMRKISLKMLSMETRTQHAPRNAQVIPNQYNPNEGWLR